MILLLTFAFLAGIVTILSPCILPILPIVLSSTGLGLTRDTKRPFGVVTGFVLSFTFFTLFLSTIVQLSGIPADSLRFFSIILIALFGVALIIPKFQILLERLFSVVSRYIPQRQQRTGFWGGTLIGFSIGLLWTPCVGPILASVISLAISGNVTFDAFLITLSYAVGTGLPMFLLIVGGQKVLRSIPWLLSHAEMIQKVFGLIMILTAIGLFFNIDRRFQTYILTTFPTYGTGLTKFEDTESIRRVLDTIGTQSPKAEKHNSVEGILLAPEIRAPELIPGGEWFNVPEKEQGLTLSKLRGKVVLVDFWTYSCINCQRTLPYLRSWYEKYQDAGLVIIGVHSPEFEFEKNPKNVTRALQDFTLTYPVMQDNDFQTWRAYNNNYWPAKYLIDKDGFVRYYHFGEGNYEETEQAIQALLSETGAKVQDPLTKEPGQQQSSSLTPETYLGSKRLTRLANEEPITGEKQRFTLPVYLDVDQIALSGQWKITGESAIAEENAQLFLKFYAGQVYLVITPSEKDTIEVLLDGQKVSQSVSGKDVKEGKVQLDSARLYYLIDLNGKLGVHTLQLKVGNAGTSFYAFTFGS